MGHFRYQCGLQTSVAGGTLAPVMDDPGLRTHNIGTWFVLFGAFLKLMPRTLTAWEEVLRTPGRDAGVWACT